MPKTVDPGDIRNPEDPSLYIPFDIVAETIGAKTQDQRDALGELITDFAKDKKDVVERKGARYIRWNILWNISEFVEPGKSKEADALYDNRVALEGASGDLDELASTAQDAEPPARGRSAGRGAGRGAAAEPEEDETQSRLNAALKGVEEPEDDQATDPEPAKPARRRAAKKPEPEEEPEAPAAPPARRRRAAAPDAEEPEEAQEAVPSTTGRNLDRIARENAASGGMTSHEYLLTREAALRAELAVVTSLLKSYV